MKMDTVDFAKVISDETILLINIEDKELNLFRDVFVGDLVGELVLYRQLIRYKALQEICKRRIDHALLEAKRNDIGKDLSVLDNLLVKGMNDYFNMLEKEKIN